MPYLISGIIELGSNTLNDAGQTIVATISTSLWTLLVFIPIIQVTEITFLSLFSEGITYIGSSDY